MTLEVNHNLKLAVYVSKTIPTSQGWGRGGKREGVVRLVGEAQYESGAFTNLPVSKGVAQFNSLELDWVAKLDCELKG